MKRHISKNKAKEEIDEPENKEKKDNWYPVLFPSLTWNEYRTKVNFNRLSDVPQKMVKDEIVVAGSQNDMVEQIGHSNEIANSQNKPYTYNSKQHPAQFIQVIPKSQFFNFCHY